MKDKVNKQKIIEVLFEYPLIYFVLYFLYVSRSQFYVIKGFAIAESVFHNLLIVWGLLIILFNVYMKNIKYFSEKKIYIFWMISAIITIISNYYIIKGESIRSEILTIIVMVLFLESYKNLSSKYSKATIFKSIFYPTFILKIFLHVISLLLYFLNISIFVIGESTAPYVYGIRYVALENNLYNILLYGTFFSPNREATYVVPLIIMAIFILKSTQINTNKVEKYFIYIYIFIEVLIVSLCNSRGVLYVLILLSVMYIIFELYKNRKNITTKLAIRLVKISVIICMLFTFQYSVKRTATYIINNFHNQKYVYDNSGKNIKRLSLDDINSEKYEKYRGWIFEYSDSKENKNGISQDKDKDNIVIEKQDSGEEVGNGRISIWKEVLTLYRGHPIFGIAQGMNKDMALNHKNLDLPILRTGQAIHNSYLGVLLYHGIVGFIILMVWLIRKLINYGKLYFRYKKNENILILFMICFILLTSQFSDVIFMRDELAQIILLFSIGYLDIDKFGIQE